MNTCKSKVVKPQKVVKLSFKKLLFIDEDLYDNINSLPNILKHRIFITKMRDFWKDYVPLTSKIPSWYPGYMKQLQILLDCQLKNIHFSHLSCNTLESNKKFICGCQCSFCSDYNDEFKVLSYINKYYRHIDDKPYTEFRWNDAGIFDPHYDIGNLKTTINNKYIYFGSHWSLL